MTSDTDAITLPSPSHIGVVVEDIDKTTQFLSSILGLGPWHSLELTLNKDQILVGEPFKLKAAHAKLGPLLLELIQPVEGKTIWVEFLRTKGEGLHHIAYDVPNWGEWVSKFKAHGGKMVAGGISWGNHWCYFDIKPGGIIIELADLGIHADIEKSLS